MDDRALARMDTDQLLAFVRVVRDGSFSRAALSLGMGQPAVSARIQALEGALGGPLFVRGRRVALTALGESFLPYARRTLDVLAEGADTARLAQGGQRGRVSLASLGSLAGGLVGPALARFLEAHPEVECLMRSADHEQVIALLWDGLVELGVVAWPCPEAVAADLTALVLMREPVPLIAHRDHPLARARRVDEQALVRLGRPLIRLRWWPAHDPTITRLAREAGTPMEVPMETARRLVLAGRGVGFFTRTYVAEDLARGDLVAIEVRGLAPLTRDSAVVRRARPAPLSPASAALVDAIAREARSLGILARGRRRR